MSGTCLFFGVLGLLIGMGDEGPAAAELARFEGVWSFSVVEVDGVKQPDVPFETNKIVVSKNGKYVVMQGPRITHGIMTVDPTASPKRMDVTITNGPAKGQTFTAIYELEGDTYTFCSSLNGKDRPSAICRKAGEGCLFEILKREKQSAKDGWIEVLRRELAGTWSLKTEPADAKGEVETADSRLEFELAGKMTIREGKEILHSSQVRLDPTADPMILDTTRLDGPAAGQTELGIFKLEGETLTICQAIAGNPRPTEFKPLPKGGQAVLTFVRTAGNQP